MSAGLLCKWTQHFIVCMYICIYGNAKHVYTIVQMFEENWVANGTKGPGITTVICVYKLHTKQYLLRGDFNCPGSSIKHRNRCSACWHFIDVQPCRNNWLSAALTHKMATHWTYWLYQTSGAILTPTYMVTYMVEQGRVVNGRAWRPGSWLDRLHFASAVPSRLASRGPTTADCRSSCCWVWQQTMMTMIVRKSKQRCVEPPPV